MAGLIARINWVARMCGKTVTRSTHCKAARSSARSLSAAIGRPLPFNSRTERSPFKPTARKSPSARAACKYRTCPTWSRSKQPFVATSFLPLPRSVSHRSETSLKSITFGLMLFEFSYRLTSRRKVPNRRAKSSSKSHLERQHSHLAFQ